MADDQSLWRALGVALPDLNYTVNDTELQAKGSTKFAAFSSTPVTVAVWNDFFSSIVANARGSDQAGSSDGVKGDLAAAMESQVIADIVAEEDVTRGALTLLLAAFRQTEVGIKFLATNKYTLSDPDIIAQRPANENKFLKIVKKSVRKDKYQKDRRENVLFTFETKPSWKYQFLLDTSDSAQRIGQLWNSLDEKGMKYTLDTKKQPKNWTNGQVKVFHLIRQVYGQMVSSERRFGVMHIYEKWWFCCRNEQGELKISPEILRGQTDMSVLQCIFALSMSDSLILTESASHRVSPTKRKQESEQDDDDDIDDGKPCAKKRPQSTRRACGSGKSASGVAGNRGTAHATLASTVSIEDCELLYTTDHVKLATHRSHPTVLMKLAGRKAHVIAEMEQEILVYDKLTKLPLASKVIPQYYGWSQNLGTPLLCLGREGPTLDDIGVANASKALRLSALEAVKCLSKVGLIHGDLEPRNIVQSRTDLARALIIDFGRASFSNDQQELDQQIEEAKRTLLL